MGKKGRFHHVLLFKFNEGVRVSEVRNICSVYTEDSIDESSIKNGFPISGREILA